MNRPVQDEPAEGGDIPDAGPGAEHADQRPGPADRPLDEPPTGDEDSGPLIGNTPDDEADGPLRPGREQPDGMSG
ncbi:MAG TPA: hypothetical protein VGC84_01075 [Ilumatobacteraceae bacterium]